MHSRRLTELVHSRLPKIGVENLRFDLIEKGGSGRYFYRVSDSNHPGDSWIAMVYSDDRPDNARFGSITEFLLNHRVAVPQIIDRKEDEGFLLVQDLGDTDLGDYAGSDWEMVARPRYEAALNTVFALHQIREDSPPDDIPELEFCFDADLYQWEQDYFFNHYVSHFGHPSAMALREDGSFRELRDQLASLPRSLVHRDFQSTNVMFHNDQCYLIDYQGMRFGLPEYDVASLLYDPYVEIDATRRLGLQNYYFDLKTAAGHRETRQEFDERLNACATQRLMQALGAYGFLGLKKGKADFLKHIAPAKPRLREVSRSVCPILCESILTED